VGEYEVEPETDIDHRLLLETLLICKLHVVVLRWCVAAGASPRTSGEGLRRGCTAKLTAWGPTLLYLSEFHCLFDDMELL
jgi:hypothetical protein